MAKIKNKKAIEKELQDQVKKLDWDDLAYDIISMEYAKSIEKDSKYMILLEMKLEIWESEKLSRLVDSFDMGYFLNKE